MSGFTALNVEPEDTFEEEIDDTKEIQIEEAFKLYQNALKLHSQGPEFYPAADEAYKELFRSEVFKYPEVVTDYGHEQLDDVIAVPTPANDQAPVPVLPSTAADSAANSLPQLIYLSYKNRGQFVLDVARHDLKNPDLDRRSASLYYAEYCLRSLADSASALERDDTDLDLWKRAARISDVLASQRLARFCLESVVAGDDDTGEQTVDLSGLDEAFASGELLEVLRLIQDDLAVKQTSATQAQDRLLPLLRKCNDPYPFLPQRAMYLSYLHDNQSPNNLTSRSITVSIAEQTQVALADAIAQALNKHNMREDEGNLGAFVTISLPSTTDVAVMASSPTDYEDGGGKFAEAIVNDELTGVKTASSPGSPQSVASYHSAQDEVNPDPETREPDPPEAEAPETETAIQEVDQPVSQDQLQSEMRLPTRKRSSTAAGNEEPEARTKSKRLRARESLLEVTAQEEETAQENDYYIREQLAIIEDSDNACLIYLSSLLSTLGIKGFETAEETRLLPDVTNDSEPTTGDGAQSTPIEDMKQVVRNWTEETSAAIMSGHSSRDVIEKTGGMSLFQRHLKATLPEDVKQISLKDDDAVVTTFIRSVNRSTSTLADVAILWLMQILTSSSTPRDLDSSYLRSSWPSGMKESISRVVRTIDEPLFGQISDSIRSFDSSKTGDRTLSIASQGWPLAKTAELVQTLFEIHLDEYYSLKNPEIQSANMSNDNSKASEGDRLHRWAQMAVDVMQIYHQNESAGLNDDPLILRFLLTSTLVVGLSIGDDKSHVLSCLAEVRKALEVAGSPVITLVNSKAIPQVSVAAVDQEVSRLSTLDFFNSIFDSDNTDPVNTIMKLEPVLEPEGVVVEKAIGHGESSKSAQLNRITELRSFLDAGDASLKLFLWRRLQNGYAAISYPPKVISCLLRSLQIIAQEIGTERHRLLKADERQLTMLRWLRDADEIVTKILSKVTDEPKPFESLDEANLYSSITTVVSLLEVLRCFVAYDDSIRLGQTSAPSLRTNTAMKLFEKSRDKMRDAFVRGWTLLYHLLREATVQLPEHFEHPVDQLAEYLRLVHNMLGSRLYCKQCNKLFVKLAKTEFFSTRSKIDYTEDIAQILFDLYQIKLGIGFGDANHGCTADPLGRDKDTAFNLVPVIMGYARKLNMRELIKSELKGTVDKIQQTLGLGKASPAFSFNRKAVSTFLKSPINPQEVYRSLKGLGDLLTKPVSGEYAKVAAHGWYQMLGRMSLAKYKSVKRVNPTPTDDLDTAATFLRLDVEHDIANWESWYRLAQVFDAKIEDSLIWNSLKINDSRSEIAVLERSAINAYTMGIAMAMRSAEDSIDTVQKISDMFAEFALRLYSSSRPPLSMEAFNTDKNMRHLSSSHDQSMSKIPFVFPFKPYAVWSLAAHLLRRKFSSGQKEWVWYYTLGKCLWKMFQSADNKDAKKPVTKEDVLDAFVDAVETVPNKEKSSEYILEPHYKLASVVHKMVSRHDLSPSQGEEYLQASHFARAVHLSREEQESEWDSYILEILRKLGHADKSNWHHRITARAAHINYDDNMTVAGALGAKHQFTQQIFTKTMTMQVWKPEYERPGRHYVYTGRYLSFFVHILDRLNDRAALEQLVRRIRRKTTDFLDHPRIWEETALTYVKLLRRVGKIPEGHERKVFDPISYEEFSKMSEKVEKWAHDPDVSTPYQDIVQDAIELKKLNNSLMKGPAIDDLIGDAYACIYEKFVSDLPPEEVAPAPAPLPPQGTFINMNTDIVPTGDDNLDRMRLNNLLHAQTDGSTGGSAPDGTTLGPGLKTPHSNTPPTEPVRIPTPSKPGRTKTITRREVQRKAEACLVKPAPIKTPTLAKRPFIDLPGRRDSTASNLQDGADDAVPESSRVSSRRSSKSPRASAEPDETGRDAPAGGEDDEDGEADDESELSDLENDDDEDGSKSGRAASATDAETSNRKRKAEDEDAEDDANENGDGYEDEEEQQHANNIDDGEETGADLGKDEMEVDDNEDSVLEIQDSQEPVPSPAPAPAPPPTETTTVSAPEPAPESSRKMLRRNTRKSQM